MTTNETIKLNNQANRDKISHAGDVKKQQFVSRRLKTVSDHNIWDSRIHRMPIYETVDIILDQIRSLLDISVKINQYFGRQLLFALSSAFICITVQLYYLIMHMRFGFEEAVRIFAFCSCVLIAIHIIEFGVILLPSDKVKNEVGFAKVLQTDLNFELISIRLGTRINE